MQLEALKNKFWYDFKFAKAGSKDKIFLNIIEIL